MQLIILGMHRSGTSVLARLVNLMGVYFGPEGISTGANDENPKGFWERRDVRTLNDSVLHSMDCDWNRLSRFDLRQISKDTEKVFHKRASNLVLNLDAHRPWLIKEPRLCLLLPLWRRYLEAPICIHILRHPAEVAGSLQTRNGIPLEVGLALWETYVRAAVAASADLPHVVVSHRAIVEQPVEATGKLFRQLQALGVRGISEPPASEISSFVSLDLYRERIGRKDLRSLDDTPQAELFRLLTSTGTLPPLPPHDGEAEVRRVLAEYEASLPPLVVKPAVMGPTPEQLQRELGGCQRELQLLREQLASKDTQLDALGSQLELSRLDDAKADARLEAMRQELLRIDAARQEENAAWAARQAASDRSSEEQGRVIRGLREAAAESARQLEEASDARLHLEAALNHRYAQIAKLAGILASAPDPLA